MIHLVIFITCFSSMMKRIDLVYAQYYLQTIAGTGVSSSTGDHEPATFASLHDPINLWGDTIGNLYIAEYYGCRIRKISTSGIITTFIGTGTSSSAGASGTASSVSLTNAYGVYGDSNHEYLYFSDSNYFVWQYSFTSNITKRYAGAVPASYAFAGDGGLATSAKFNYAMGIFLSTAGVLYIADRSNNRIRFINTANEYIYTFAGNGTTGYGGDNQQATSASLNNPTGIWGNTVGVIYIADCGNNRVRMVNTAGIITTFAGTGSSTYNGDGIPATLATLNSPDAVKGDSNGAIYIGESSGCRIRIVVAGIMQTLLGTGTCTAATTVAQLAAGQSMDVSEGFWIDSMGTLFFTEDVGYVRKLFNGSPTSQPTSQPTQFPTDQPSSQPSNLPTDYPTSQPTRTPSSQPVAEPSSRPTKYPSSSPTAFLTTVLKYELIAYYPFDDNADDASGNVENNGIVHDCTSVPDRFGRLNSSYLFTGSSYIELPGSNFNLNENLGLSFWIYPVEIENSYSTIFDKSSWSAAGGWMAGYIVQQYASNLGQYGLITVVSKVEETGRLPTFNVQSNIWSHVVINKRGKNIMYYVNGAWFANNTSSSPMISPNGNLPLVLGAANYGQTVPASALSDFFQGRLDDVMIFNRTLSFHEIIYLHTFDLPTSQPTTLPSSQPTNLPSISPSTQPTSMPTSQSVSYPSAHPTNQPSGELILSQNLTFDYTFSRNDLNKAGYLLNHATGNYDAQLMNGATCVSLNIKAGRISSALSLNSVSLQYLQLPSFTSPAMSGMSFAFWYRPNNCGTSSIVLDLGNGNIDNIQYQANGSSYVYQSGSSTTYEDIENPTQCNNNIWCFIVWTIAYGGSLTSQTSKQIVYMNGTIYSQGLSYYPAPVLRSNNYLGKSNDADPYCTELISRFQMYNWVLNATEVKNLYTINEIWYPTGQPSSQPTSRPTKRPSSQPTCQPTGQPAAHPSSQPTTQPTTQPSSNLLLSSNLTFDYTFSPDDVNKAGYVLNHASGNYDAQLMSGAACIRLSSEGGVTSALSLNSATSQYLQLPAFTSSSKEGMSFAFWYRSNSCQVYSIVLDFGNGDIDNIQYEANGYSYVYQGSSSLNYAGIQNPLQCNDNIWCFIVWTIAYGGSLTSQTSKQIVYMNGTIYSQGLSYYPAPVLRSNNYLGKSNDADPYCTELISRFQMYNWVLNATEVKNLYTINEIWYPTGQPSSQPTSRPTKRPSSQPTCQPTGQPAAHPSSQPTTQPTTQPSSNLLLSSNLTFDYTFSPDDVNKAGYVLNHASGNYDAQLMSGAACIRLSSEGGVTSALSLNSATSQYLQLPAFTSPVRTGMSFAFWFRANSCGGNTSVFDFGNGPDNANIQYEAYGFAIVYEGSTTSYSSLPIPSSCNNNIWCFIVWTIAYGSTTNLTSKQIMYLNGTLYSQGFGYYPRPVVRSNNYLGKSNFTTNEVFCTELISRFQMYNWVLNATEVKNLYTINELWYPTGQPSSQPTRRPSRRPSAQPTRRPSMRPSSQPTKRPSIGPSSQPTYMPSTKPTKIPSSAPSVKPSSKPSSQPTNIPLAKPSAQPTTRPSCDPSTQPSSQPTNDPSGCPSSQPTTAPSSPPTIAPSMKPSSEPTHDPSGCPSSQPTTAPSSPPTIAPSMKPSSEPTHDPSGCPSSQPTIAPSSPPTIAPSMKPSSEPTHDPSGCPSSQPTSVPTSQPTNHPSPDPTARSLTQPTIRPSSNPTVEPSIQPSIRPSSYPSSRPSTRPRSKPSSHPTRQPTNLLSSQPSGHPTSLPASSPSTAPTMIPTSTPSVFPSSKPSLQPTSWPTTFPSEQPTTQLSSYPTFTPISQPTMVATVQPTTNPSGQPTIQPSCQPTAIPTIKPSTQPSIQPTSSPTNQPSFKPTTPPTTQPSNQPTSRPTDQPSTQPTSRPSLSPKSSPSSHPTSRPSRPTVIPSMFPSSRYSHKPTLFPTFIPTHHPSVCPSHSPSYTPTYAPTAVLMTVNTNQTNWKEVLCLIGVYAFTDRYETFHELVCENPKEGEGSILFGGKTLSSSTFINATQRNYETAKRASTYRRDSVSRSALIPGDLNGDGWNDLFLCNPILSACYIFYGTEEGITNVQIGATIYGTSSSDYFGFSLASAGDMNKDGVLDMIVYALSKKTCYVLYGGSSLSKRLMISEMTIGEGYEIVGDSAEISLVGMSVTGLGDMNDDGYDDIAISVMTSVSSRSNVVYVIYGNGKGEKVLLSSVGNGMGGFQIIGEAGYYMGFSISGVGDVNGDGLADLAIGKLPYPGTTSTQSSIIIFGSREGGDVLLSSASENDEVGGRVLLVEGGGGFIVSGIGDINHDGFADVLLSASYDYVGESNAYIVTYPTDITSPPNLQPSSSPSTHPSSRPSLGQTTPFPSLSLSSTPSASFSPSFRNETSIPTKPPSYLPSRQVKTPSVQSTINSSTLFAPSIIPTISPSFVHTQAPTPRPSRSLRKSISQHPSSRPSAYPTRVSYNSSEVVVILTEGLYVGSSGEKQEMFEIEGSGVIEIEGGREGGGNIYVIYPPLSAANKTVVTISDFNIERDTIDLQHLPAIQSVKDISFSDDPLTMYLTKNVKVICSSLSSTQPNQIRFIFGVRGTTSTTMSIISQLFQNPLVICAMIILGYCLLFIVGGNFDREEDTSRAKNDGEDDDSDGLLSKGVHEIMVLPSLKEEDSNSHNAESRSSATHSLNPLLMENNSRSSSSSSSSSLSSSSSSAEYESNELSFSPPTLSSAYELNSTD